MKFFWTLLAIAVLAGGAYFGWTKMPRSAQANRPLLRPTTATVEVRDVRFSVSAAGDIGPAEQVSVRPEVNGRIAELPVDIGDQVKKGDLLCRLDDKDLQIERTQRLAEIDGAKLQVEKAHRAYRRSEELVADHLIAPELFEDARTDYHLATNTLERAIHALHLVEDRLSKTKILAPFDCTILTRPVSAGQAVSGSAGFNSGTEILSIANLNDMIITAHINQADIIRLNNGQVVEANVESVPGLRIQGVIDRISPQAVIKNGVKGFTARVQLKDLDARVRPGMTAILTIPVGEALNVLAVPLASVYTDPELNERYVFVKEGEKAERRAVEIGMTDNFYAEVRGGLNEGEIVSMGDTPERSGPGGPGGGERRGTIVGGNVTPGAPATAARPSQGGGERRRSDGPRPGRGAAGS